MISLTSGSNSLSLHQYNMSLSYSSLLSVNVCSKVKLTDTDIWCAAAFNISKIWMDIDHSWYVGLSVFVRLQFKRHRKAPEWKSETVVRVEKRVPGALYAQACPARWELNVYSIVYKATGEPDSSTQTAALSLGGKEWNQRKVKVSSLKPSLYGLIWLLALPVLLLQGG